MKLYKYRYGSKRDLESLQNNYFYVPHAIALNDPSENLFNEQDVYSELEIFENLSGLSTSDIKKQVEGLCKKVRAEIGIFSLSQTFNDELLWAYYADSHSGFCIEYDLEKINELRAFSCAFEVEYADKRPKLKLHNLIQSGEKEIEDFLRITSGTKSKKWKHEQEFRICIEPFGRFIYDYRAVKAIYFGMRMPKLKKDLAKDNNKKPDSSAKVCQQQVMEILKGRGIKYYQMQLKPDSYEFEYQEVEDMYKNSKKYKDKTHIIPIDQIDYKDYGHGIEKHYFDKVAYIITKEPYFYELNSIHISKEESIKRNEPIIFAGFFHEKNNPRQIKRYFTLNEIDKEYQKVIGASK